MSKRVVPRDEVLVDLYLEKKLSSGEIAKKYNVSRTTVCKHLKRLGITRPESGPNSRNRNYNKKQHRSGYPVTFNPAHHRSNNIGYVFDHILVMEKVHQRKISRNEVVHHVDMDRKNNHESNLYLCKSHKEHQACHNSLNSVAQDLIKKGVIKFKDGKYYV